MNTILVIVIGVSIGLLIFFFNPLNIITTTIQPLIETTVTQISANPTAVLTGVIPTVCAVGGVAWKALSSIKNRAKDEVNQIAVNANSQVQDSQNQVLQLQTEKQGLETKIAELESLPNDAEELLKSLNVKEAENKRLRTSNQTLMDALKRDKLGANETIIKTVAL